MEVKIHSDELVKPSSPTPEHLRIFKLSLLDQLVQVPFTPVIFFYPSNSDSKSGDQLDVPQKLALLKKSLSVALTKFYPLAGKILNGLTIECNDEGARYVEASVDMSLTQLLSVPDIVSFNKLLPSGCEFVVGEYTELIHPANIQVNVFRCGGIAIVICNTHKLHDGVSIYKFMKEWAAVVLGGGCSMSSLVAARELLEPGELFPANDLLMSDIAKLAFISMCKIRNSVTERFFFTRSAIEALRELGKGSDMKKPSRVEAVTGFLWKCATSALERNNCGLRKPTAFTHLVNIRNRVNPPLSGPIGNILATATAQYGKNIGPHSNDNDTFTSMVRELRAAMSKVDHDLLSGLNQDKHFLTRYIGEMAGVGLPGDGVDTFICSSWSGLGFYDIDFGWGRPIWVSSVGFRKSMFLNLLFIGETREGNGLEAWVSMGEQEMALLRDDPELRTFAHINPSPLIYNSKL